MDTNSLQEGLRNLAEANKSVQKTRAIKSLLPDIENAISSGASMAMVANYLNMNGIPISVGYLKNILARIRKNPENKKTKISNINNRDVSNLTKKGHFQSHSNPDIAKANEIAEQSYLKLEEAYIYLEEYAHVSRIRKINGKLTFATGTPEEEYYSLGKDPREIQKLSPRQKDSTVASQFMTALTREYIYQNIIKEQL